MKNKQPYLGIAVFAMQPETGDYARVAEFARVG